MLKLAWLRNFIVPTAILFIFIFCLAVYYRYWVPDRQRHLDDRGFRYLKILSDQIRLTLNTYDKMMDYAVEAGIVTSSTNTDDEKVKLNAYLQIVDPTLQALGGDEAKQVVGEDYSDPPKIAIQADEGTHFLYLAFHRSEETGDFAVRTDLDRLIRRLLGAPELSPFDVLLVARSDGKVIFEQSISGIEVAQIKNLEDPSGDGKGGSSKQIDASLLASASRLAEVRIAGALYRLYSQPVQIGFLPTHPGEDGAKYAKAKATATPTTKGPAADSESNSQTSSNGTNIADDTWVLCGLVRADRFRAESQLIPYNYVLLVFAVIVLAAAAYPLLKVHLSIPGERMLARDVTIVAVFVCLVTVVLTFVLADAYYWNALFGPAAEEEMAKLAHAINRNFDLEQRKVRDLLTELDKRPELKTDIAATMIEPDVRLNYSADLTLDSGREPCTPFSACKTNVLNDDNTESWFETYPNLLFVAWSDKYGKQRIKWTTRKFPTPYVQLDESSAPYYPDVRQALDDNLPDSSRTRQGIGSQYSPTTGQNVTIFWQLTDTKAAPKDKYVTSLVTQPISLYDAVLPGGYQFAVLTPDGTVVFHSDTTRNLRENFFAETDNDPTLVSRVKMHAKGTVDSNYMGQPHRMYVQPMHAGNQGGPWSLVIFRDRLLEETMNLEIVSLVSIIFSFYAGVIAVIVLVVYRLRKDHPVRTWFWPDSRNADRYCQMVQANFMAAALLLLLARYLPGGALLLCASIIPAAMLLLNIFVLSGRKETDYSETTADGAMSRKCQTAYLAACVSLLVAICVIPCVCYFKVACNFEQKRFVQHQQLMLAAALEKRDLDFAELYQSTYLSNYYKKTVLTRPEEQHVVSDSSKAPIYSYHEFLGTRVCPVPATPKTGMQDSTHKLSESDDRTGVQDSSNKLPECDDRNAVTEGDGFLVGISLPYSERFADEKHLGESLEAESKARKERAPGAENAPAARGTSLVWRWTVEPLGDDRVLHLEVNEEQVNEKPSLKIASLWTPSHFPWDHVSWWLWFASLLIGITLFVRSILKRIFSLDLATPRPLADTEVKPTRLISDLPVNLLIIGSESREPISRLVNRADVQSYEAEQLLRVPPLQPETPPEKPDASAKVATPSDDPTHQEVESDRHLVLRHFERLPDDAAIATAAHAALLRLQSIVKASVIIITSVDPQSMPSIESSDRWRTLLRSYVLIDLDWHSARRKNEPEEDYQERISMESYYHWLISGMSRSDKLVLLQLAQERVVNPSSSGIVYQLIEQGMIERKFGLLEVKDEGFATVLHDAIPRDTVRDWEKQIAGTKQFPLQTVMAILGLGIIGFLVYTQGEIFNTWITYAAGFTSTLPKILQVIDNFRFGKAAKA